MSGHQMETANFCILNLSFQNPFVWEVMSSIRHSVSSPDETPRRSSKILRCASYFSTLFLVFQLVMNHCNSFLIYYLKNRQKLTGKFGLLYKLRCFTGRLSLKRSWRKNTNITKLLFSGNQWLTSCCLLW